MLFIPIFMLFVEFVLLLSFVDGIMTVNFLILERVVICMKFKALATICAAGVAIIAGRGALANGDIGYSINNNITQQMGYEQLLEGEDISKYIEKCGGIDKIDDMKSKAKSEYLKFNSNTSNSNKNDSKQDEKLADIAQKYGLEKQEKRVDCQDSYMVIRDIESNHISNIWAIYNLNDEKTISISWASIDSDKQDDIWRVKLYELNESKGEYEKSPVILEYETAKIILRAIQRVLIL